MPYVPDAPGRDETPGEFLARFSSQPTPAFDKLSAWAADWKRVEEEEKALMRKLQEEADAHAEMQFQDSHDKYWSARAASDEDLSGDGA